MKLKSLLLCILLSISVHAGATTYNLPGPTFSQQSIVMPTGVGFVDRFNFSLGAPATLFATVSVDPGLGSFSVALFKVAAPVSLGSFTGSAGPVQSKTYSGLTAGDYYFQAAGVLPSLGTRLYTLSANPLVAPEPATFLLAMLGIAMVFWLRRRHSRK